MHRPQYRPELDGLRALAVLLVVAYHYGFAGFSGGFVGVDVFFVLSGYLITSQVLYEAESKGYYASGSLVEFYARRVRRILPASSVVLASISVAVALLLGLDRLADLSKELVLSALFLGNVAAGSAGDYLSGVTRPSPVRHYWSLAVEEQFYLLWPLLAALAVRYVPGRPARSLRALALIVMTASLTLSVLLTERHPTWSYYLPHTRAWAIAAGALMATSALPRRVFGVYPLMLLLVSLLAVGPESVYPGLLAVLPVLATCGFLLLPETSKVSGILSARPLRYLGQLSFSVYLWHWPVLVVLEERYGYFSVPSKMALTAAVLAVSAATYHLLENPIRHSAGLRLSASRSLLVLPAALAVSVALPVGALLHAPGSAGSGTPAQQASIAEKPTLPPAPSRSTTARESVPDPTVPPPMASSVYLLGDSTLAPLRWFVGASASLSGFEYTLDAESCRKLSSKGCEGREGRVPPSAVDTLRSAPRADVLLVMGGYHSHPTKILKEFRATIEAARTAGFGRIVWLSWRESREFPGLGGDESMYSSFNSSVLEEIGSGGYEDVFWADWNSYSAREPSWFTKDGIHVNLRGSLALGEFISDTLAHVDQRPCPATSPGVCPYPPAPADSAGLLGKYGLVDTIEHCYEMGPERIRRCKPDRLQVEN